MARRHSRTRADLTAGSGREVPRSAEAFTAWAATGPGRPQSRDLLRACGHGRPWGGIAGPWTSRDLVVLPIATRGGLNRMKLFPRQRMSRFDNQIITTTIWNSTGFHAIHIRPSGPKFKSNHCQGHILGVLSEWPSGQAGVADRTMILHADNGTSLGSLAEFIHDHRENNVISLTAGWRALAEDWSTYWGLDHVIFVRYRAL
jgi:hypothetical protein